VIATQSPVMTQGEHCRPDPHRPDGDPVGCGIRAFAASRQKFVENVTDKLSILV